MIRAEIEVPHTVIVPRGRKTVTVDVVCRLHNEGDESYVASSPEGQETHFWHLLNSDQREVQRSKPGKECESHRSHLVAGGTSDAHPEQVTLDAKKLKHGECYTLRFRVKGHSAEAEFVAVHPRERKKTKKRTAKKKPARKRVSKKRPAKKKAAKKRPARKRTARKSAKK